MLRAMSAILGSAASALSAASNGSARAGAPALSWASSEGSVMYSGMSVHHVPALAVVGIGLPADGLRRGRRCRCRALVAHHSLSRSLHVSLNARDRISEGLL